MKKWKLLRTKRLYHSEYMSLFSDRIMLPNGKEITYSRVELKDFVSILPIIDNEIVMIETFRYPVNRVSLELPSGYIEKGESLRECAFRELEEETGYKAGRLTSMGWFHPWTRSVRKAYLFLAENLTHGAQKPDVTEQIKTRKLFLDEAKKKIETSKITHAPTIIALQKFFLTKGIQRSY